MQRSSRKRSSKISQTVFRGNRCLYSFEVFPLTAKEIPDGAGVFIISRRRIDKFGSGHHNAVCIGETNSIATEIKRHRRAKCVKQTAANVICFLKEDNPHTRFEMIDDLISSRTFNCVRNEIKTAIVPRPAIVEFKPERVRRRVIVEAAPKASKIEEKESKTTKKALKTKRSSATARPKTDELRSAKSGVKRRVAKPGARSKAPKPTARKSISIVKKRAA